MSSELDYIEVKRGLNVGSLLIGVLIGATVGGVAALLLAPKSGKETQQMLKDQAISTQQMLKNRVSEVRDRFGQVKEHMRDRAEKEMQAVESEHKPG